MKEREIAAAVMLLICACGPAWAQESSSRPAGAASPAAKAPDVCKDAVDPYDAAGERVRFFAATGKESDLTAETFDASAKAQGGFVRPFDSWKAMLIFDKDGNGKIDWFEADAYRQGLRTKILAMFDKDKDGKLSADERQAANAFLASAKAEALLKSPVGPIAVGPAATGPAPTSGSWPDFKPDWAATNKRLADLLKTYDTNGDGKLDTQEIQAIYKDHHKLVIDMSSKMSKMSKEELKAAMDRATAIGQGLFELARYDKNRDGVIDKEEQEAGVKYEAGVKKQMDEMEAEKLRKYDKNGDGKLDIDETKAMLESQRRDAEQMMREFELKAYDKNHDGVLDDEERKAMEADKKRQRDQFKKMLTSMEAKGAKPAAE